MAESSPNPWDAIAEDLARELEEIGREIIDDRRQALSVPVEYVTGPRGGVRVIRSKPGEPPRRETGNLQGSLQARVFHEAGVVELVIDTPVTYGETLQNELQRIIFNPVDDLFGDRIDEASARAVSKGNGA